MRCWILTLIMLAAAGLSGCQRDVVAHEEAREGERAVLFASSRIGSAWTAPQFSSIPEQAMPPSECEGRIAEALTPEIEVFWPSSFTSHQQDDARRLRPVFGRYKDASALPNDTAAKAAQIVDPGTALILACGAGMDAPRKRGKLAGQTCLQARCKAIDRASRKRVATSDIRRCEPLSSEASARARTMAQLCSEIGRDLARELAFQGRPSR